MVDTPIGTNSPNYTLVSGDVGATIFCRVTATNASGSAQAFSNAVGPVAAAAAPSFSTWSTTDKYETADIDPCVLGRQQDCNRHVSRRGNLQGGHAWDSV